MAGSDTELRKDIVECLKYVGDMDHELHKDTDRLFDKNFPWDHVRKAVYAMADIRFKYFPEIATWDLTNDTEYRSSMLKALHRDENGNKLPEEEIR